MNPDADPRAEPVDRLEFAEPTVRETLDLAPPPAGRSDSLELLPPLEQPDADSPHLDGEVEDADLEADFQPTGVLTGFRVLWEQRSQLDLGSVTDEELRPARLQVGLTLCGFGALLLMFVLLHASVFHPEFDSAERMRTYGTVYRWFVGLGVSGLFLFAREMIRPAIVLEEDTEEAFEEDLEESLGEGLQEDLQEEIEVKIAPEEALTRQPGDNSAPKD